jgi:hypothetical protein
MKHLFSLTILFLLLGLSESGRKQILSVIETDVGKNEADAGRKVPSGVIAARNK